jgi:carboxynorspermidine decarboxylase
MDQSPVYVLEESKLTRNLEILSDIQEKSGAKILVALKGYALWKSFALIGRYLCGASASGLYEARLAREEMNREVHTFCPAIKTEEIGEIARLSNHLIFNSFSQLERFCASALEANGDLQIGIRVNPQYSEVEPSMYNPCLDGSRLGVTQLRGEALANVSGLHFHTHCEQNSYALKRTIVHFERRFGRFMGQGIRWINMGGGHHITRADYDREELINIIRRFSDKWGVQVYLEPGEAVGWQAGYLEGRVVDLTRNVIDIAILDISAAAHMPDVLEMPYRPEVRGAGEAGEKRCTYRLGAPTCLAGDVIGDYSFDEPLQIGDKIVFEDMIHYTMVKNNAFNGIPLPAIAIERVGGGREIIRRFTYEDYKNRLS